CSLHKFAGTFVSAIEKNKFITKTKDSARWDFGGSVCQISQRPLFEPLCPVLLVLNQLTRALPFST
ncbi:hypothetical protein N9J06_01990, partial [Flavobacteriales bacterium]|nr:hypothetical protein [Flavobacteriales bacterium]